MKPNSIMRIEEQKKAVRAGYDMDIIPIELPAKKGTGALKTKKSSEKPVKEAKIEDIINEAVQRGIQAGRIQFDATIKDAFKTIEKRLYALPTLKLKVENDKAWLQDIRIQGTPERSKSIVRFSAHGVRLSNDDIIEAITQDTLAKIAVDEHEIETIEKALKIICDDPYLIIINKKYFEGKKDEEIAEIMHCDPSTVRRNKNRLIQRLAVFLYGARVIV